VSDVEDVDRLLDAIFHADEVAVVGAVQVHAEEVDGVHAKEVDGVPHLEELGLVALGALRKGVDEPFACSAVGIDVDQAWPPGWLIPNARATSSSRAMMIWATMTFLQCRSAVGALQRPST